MSEQLLGSIQIFWWKFSKGPEKTCISEKKKAVTIYNLNMMNIVKP